MHQVPLLSIFLSSVARGAAGAGKDLLWVHGHTVLPRAEQHAQGGRHFLSVFIAQTSSFMSLSGHRLYTIFNPVLGPAEAGTGSSLDQAPVGPCSLGKCPGSLSEAPASCLQRPEILGVFSLLGVHGVPLLLELQALGFVSGQLHVAGPSLTGGGGRGVLCCGPAEGLWSGRHFPKPDSQEGTLLRWPRGGQHRVSAGT